IWVVGLYLRHCHDRGFWLGLLSSLPALASGPSYVSLGSPLGPREGVIRPWLRASAVDQGCLSWVDAPLDLFRLRGGIHRDLPHRPASRPGAGVFVGGFLPVLQRDAR